MSNAVLEHRNTDEGRQVWRRLSWGVVAVYWLGMFAGTHWPTAPHAPFGYADKWMHFSAYGGLALLFSIAMAMRRRMTLAISVAIVALLAGYGAFDEVTQPIVGRDCDLFDWFADVTGLLIGTSCFWLGSLAWRRRPNRAV